MKPTVDKMLAKLQDPDLEAISDVLRHVMTLPEVQAMRALGRLNTCFTFAS